MHFWKTLVLFATLAIAAQCLPNVEKTADVADSMDDDLNDSSDTIEDTIDKIKAEVENSQDTDENDTSDDDNDNDGDGEDDSEDDNDGDDKDDASLDKMDETMDNNDPIFGYRRRQYRRRQRRQRRQRPGPPQFSKTTCSEHKTYFKSHLRIKVRIRVCLYCKYTPKLLKKCHSVTETRNKCVGKLVYPVPCVLKYKYEVQRPKKKKQNKKKKE